MKSNDAVQHQEIEMMSDVYEIVLAKTSPNYNCILGNFDAIYGQGNNFVRTLTYYAYEMFMPVWRVLLTSVSISRMESFPANYECLTGIIC